nr:DUF1573 domain-containing protein [Maliibacterium massiliense]
MKDLVIGEFQTNVEEMLVRHKGLLDTLSKLQEALARLNRAVVKAATTCGCITIAGKRQDIPADASLADLPQLMKTCVEGALCPTCRNIIEKELGAVLFYIAALCNTLNISMYDTIIGEQSRLSTLGMFTLR